VSELNHDYLSAMSQGSGLSMSAVVNALVDEARRRGWAIDSVPGVRIMEPES
jgi:hypothetical protein